MSIISAVFLAVGIVDWIRSGNVEDIYFITSGLFAIAEAIYSKRS